LSIALLASQDAMQAEFRGRIVAAPVFLESVRIGNYHSVIIPECVKSTQTPDAQLHI
jgi:hypothetical protein